MNKHYSEKMMLFYSHSIFALRKLGPIKWWVFTKNPKQDIRRCKFAGLAHVKKSKVCKIKVPVDHAGNFVITPYVVFQQIKYAEFMHVDGYAVKVDKSKDDMENIRPRQCEAEVTLYTASKLPKKLVIQPAFPISTFCENKSPQNIDSRPKDKSYLEIVERSRTI